LSRTARGDRLIGRRVVEGERPERARVEELRRRQTEIAVRALGRLQ